MPRGIWGMFGILPFGPPKRLKNSRIGSCELSLSSSSSESALAVRILPVTLMLTTDAPARSASAVKSGRRAAAVGETAGVAAAATAAGVPTAALASETAWPSNFM